MKLQYLAPALVLNVLLCGIAGPAHAQSRCCVAASARGVPTRLIASSSEYGHDVACAQKPSSSPSLGRYFGVITGRRPLGGPTSACGCEPDCGCEVSCDCETNCTCAADSDCNLHAVVGRVLSRLDAASRSMCGGCRSRSCSTCCYQMHYYASKPRYGYEDGCRCEPDEPSMPEPEEELDAPLLEGDPFEDDPVQPPSPPVALEARGGGVYPIRVVSAVIYTRSASPLAVNSPARFRPDNAMPIVREARPTRCILDVEEINSSPTRR